MMLLSGCASPVVAPVSRDVPGPPAYLRTVELPAPKAGEFCEVVADRERSGRKRANIIIGSARRDWQAMSVTFKRGK
jgi:hypothetical protein